MRVDDPTEARRTRAPRPLLLLAAWLTALLMATTNASNSTAPALALALGRRTVTGPTSVRGWSDKWSSLSCYYADLTGRRVYSASGLAVRPDPASDVQAVDADATFTAYLLASVSKTVTFTSLTMLYDRGLFELDDDVSVALGWTLRNPRHPDAPVTFRQFYTHSTSMSNFPPAQHLFMYGPSGVAIDGGVAKGNPSCPIKTTVSAFFNEYLRDGRETSVGGKEWFFGRKAPWDSFKPGTTSRYSNQAAAFVAVLVEALSQKSFKAFTKEEIFEPLGMTRTAWDFNALPISATPAVPYAYATRRERKKNGRSPFRLTNARPYCFVDYPNGGLWSTAKDMAAFNVALITPDKLVSREALDATFACQDDACQWGLGWGLNPNRSQDSGVCVRNADAKGIKNVCRTPSHSGGEQGVASLSVVNPERGYVYGCLANSEKPVDEPTLRMLQAGRNCPFRVSKAECLRVAGCGWRARGKPRCTLRSP